jgi:predicted dehydrogenase
MRIAIVGCGYVADFYIQTLPLHPEIELIGVYDIDTARLKQFADFYGVGLRYESFEQLIGDARVELVLNLTNPRSHFELSMACLGAGKHVYSEKPLAMELDQARALVAEAESRGLQINSAPCNLLGEAAQTMWKALREGYVGAPRLVYANMDDGMPFKLSCHLWRNRSGAPWPYVDEFEVGVVLEHAGYVLTWLVAMLGPIQSITGVSSNLYPDKSPGEPLKVLSPDAAVATLRFASGVIARVCCTIVADDDRSFHVYGTERVLMCDDVWRYGSPVYSWRPQPTLPNLARKIYNRLRKYVHHVYPKALTQVYPAVRKAKRHKHQGNSQMDFMRGPAELAASVREGRPSRLSPRFCLHVNEAVLAIAKAGEGGVYQMTTTCDAVEPMPWAI